MIVFTLQVEKVEKFDLCTLFVYQCMYFSFSLNTSLS